ncbi:MAG: penicillin-binding protein 2 [Gammaproteobacteria bacterium]
MKKVKHNNTKTKEISGDMPNIKMRMSVVTMFLLLCFGVVAVRAFSIQVMGTEFYTEQGDMRQIREVSLPVPRGNIYDRNGEPLAISTPMVSVGVDPSKLINQISRLGQLAEVLSLDEEKLNELVVNKQDKKFIYIKRRIPPYMADSVKALNINGVEFRQEFKRYYPTYEIMPQLIGFTDANDVGKEGIENTYDKQLSGTSGRKQVMQDRKGNVIRDVKEITEAQAGEDLYLSIDRRLQYVAYKALKTAVHSRKAEKGAAIVMDAMTGEILAMASQPSYNPNNISGESIAGMRNRALHDMYEPGSVIKPFTMVAALLSGKFDEDSMIDTTPFEVDGYEFSDARNYGEIDMETVLGKSSNIGTAKIALSLEKEHLWNTFKLFGFGSSTNSGIVGESIGNIEHYNQWSNSRHANISFGYGLQVTTLQLATAYAAIANKGRWRSPTYLKGNIKQDKAIIDPDIARRVSLMLENVVTEQNTGKKARIEGYSVAGKTGTAIMAEKGGYSNKYIASFVGYAPAKEPRLIVAISIVDPKGDEYGGGAVAAPVFKTIMQDSLRILNISPDLENETQNFKAKEVANG